MWYFSLVLLWGSLVACGNSDKKENTSPSPVELEDIGEVNGVWLTAADFPSEGLINLDADEINLFAGSSDLKSLWYRYREELIDTGINAVPTDCTIPEDLKAAAKITGGMGSVEVVIEFPTASCAQEDYTYKLNFMYYKKIICDGHDFSGHSIDNNSSLPGFYTCTDGSIVYNGQMRVSEFMQSNRRVVYSNVKELKESFGGLSEETCQFTVSDSQVTFSNTCLLRKYSNDLYNYSAFTIEESEGVQRIPVGKVVSSIQYNKPTGDTSSTEMYYPEGTAKVIVNNWSGDITYDYTDFSHPFTYAFTNGTETINGTEDCLKFPVCED